MGEQHETIQSILKAGDVLAGDAPACDAVGQLTEVSARVIRESGGLRLNLPVALGGYEAHPQVFLDWVRTVAQFSPSAGWIAGVVGVHPWELAQMDPRVGQEVWGENPDVWVASPYAPTGTATPVPGGYRLTGRWKYSTGTDWCDWVVIGGVVVGNEAVGTGPDIRHFVLPRSDYEIVPDSWRVMGLKGTGSKDLIATEAFVPEHRVIEADPMYAGDFAFRQPNSPLYAMPFSSMFSAAIMSATLGIARGAIDAYREYLRDRVSVMGIVGRTDQRQQESLAEAEADWEAAVLVQREGIAGLFDAVSAGEHATTAQRLTFRRDHVRAVSHVVGSVDRLFGIAGSSAVWTDRPLERLWRDFRTGAGHVSNSPDIVYTSWANHDLGTNGYVDLHI